MDRISGPMPEGSIAAFSEHELPDGAFVEIADRDNTRFSRGERISVNPNDLLKDLGNKDVAIFQRMTRDASIRAAIKRKCSGLLQMGWEIEAPEDPTPIEKHVTEYARYVLENYVPAESDEPEYTANFNQTLMDICDAPVTGYAIAEKVFKLIGSGPFKGKIGIKKLNGLDPKEYRFKLDVFKNIEFVKTTLRGAEKTFKPSKFLIFSHEMLYGDPHGSSDLRAAHRGFKMKDQLYRWWLAATEKLGAGFLVGKYAKGTSKAEIKKFLDMLKKIKNDSVTVIPDTASIEQPALGNFADVYDKLREAADREIIQAIEGAFLHANEGTPGAKRGSSAVHENTAVRFIWYLGQQIEPVITTKLLRPLIKSSFGEQDRWPKFMFIDPGDADIGIELDNAKKAVELGVPVGQSYVYERTGIPVPKPGEPIAEVSAPAAPTLGGFPFSSRQFSEQDIRERDKIIERRDGGAIQKGQAIVKAIRDTLLQGMVGDPEMMLDADRLRSTLRGVPASIQFGAANDEFREKLFEAMLQADLVARAQIFDEVDKMRGDAEARILRPSTTPFSAFTAVIKSDRWEDGHMQAFVALSPLGGSFTPEQAFEFISSRIPMTREQFQAVSAELQRLAFTAARASNLEQVARLKSFIERAIEQGMTQRAFLQAFDADFTKAYLNTVFNNNVHSAFEGARRDVILNNDIDDVAPTLTYSTAGDRRVRGRPGGLYPDATPSHWALGGFTADRRSPVWQRLWPPLDHNCRCTVLTNLPGEATVSPSTHPGWRFAPAFAPPEVGGALGDVQAALGNAQSRI